MDDAVWNRSKSSFGVHYHLNSELLSIIIVQGTDGLFWATGSPIPGIKTYEFPHQLKAENFDEAKKEVLELLKQGIENLQQEHQRLELLSLYPL